MNVTGPRECAGLLVAALAAALAGAICVDAGEPGAASAGLAAGREPLGRLVPLAVVERRLVFDREAWARAGETGDAAAVAERESRRTRIAERRGLRPEQVPARLLAALEFGETPAVRLFEEVMARSGREDCGHSGESYGVFHRQRDVSRESSTLSGHLEEEVAEERWSLRLELEEVRGRRRRLIVDADSEVGLRVRLTSRASGTDLYLTSARAGPVALMTHSGRSATTLASVDFAALLQTAPAASQALLLDPLEEIGLAIPLNPYLPQVMAAATSGFGAPAAGVRQAAARALAQLEDEDPGVRGAAEESLSRLLPSALRHLRDEAARATTPETRARLGWILDSQPGLARAAGFAERHRLHLDRAYLLELLAKSPDFADAARARLAELYGADHGPDARDWPAPR